MERLVREGIPAEIDDPRIAGIVDLQQQLDRIGSPGLQSMEDRVVETVRAELAPAAPIRSIRWVFGGLAAVVVVSLSVWLLTRGGGEVDLTRPYLLNDEQAGVEVTTRWIGGTVEISWAHDALGATYSVAAYDGDPADGGKRLAASAAIAQPTWNPANDRVEGEVPAAEWPATIWLEITANSLTGDETIFSGALSR